MNRELTDFEKSTKLLAEKENPYAKECPNRHLYNEGFENGFSTSRKLIRELQLALNLSADNLIEKDKFNEAKELLKLCQDRHIGITLNEEITNYLNKK